MPANKFFVPFLATLGFLLAFLYQQLTSNPKATLLYANFVNKFDDQTEFNLFHNPYLHGIFAPVNKETFNLPMEVVEGEIPGDLAGAYLRVGPNPIPEQVDRGYHWFDGHGMVHLIRIKDGSATYSNRWIESNSYNKAREYNQSVFLQIGELIGVVGLIKAISVGPLLSNIFGLPTYLTGQANTAFLFYKNRLFACHEGSLPFELQITPDNSIKSIGYESFNNTLNYPFTAHSKIDPVDGGLYFDGYNVEPNQASFKYGKVQDNQVVSYFEIDTKVHSFSHDMMITENYVLIFESSIIFDVTGIVSGKLFRFESDNRLRIGVLPKKAINANDVRWFTFEKPNYIIHALNAWEEEDEIILFAPVGDDFNGLDPKNETVNDVSYMAQLRMNLQTNETKITFLPGDEIVEFPNIHPHYLGRKSQYGYAGEFEDNKLVFKNLIKYDLFANQIAAKINLPVGWLSGEPVLIPKTNIDHSTKDHSDAVYIGVFAYHRLTNESQWFLFDGETMDSKPLVRLATPGTRVPMGFHGTYLNEEQLQAHFHHTK